MFMRRSRARPAAVRPVPIVPHLPGACIVPRRARPDAAFPAPCRAPRRGEAEKRRLLKQALGRAASSKRPAAAKGTARHNIRLRRASGGNAGAGGALQGKIHACNRRAALCLAVPACPSACAAAGAPSVQPDLCRTLVCTYRERPHAALFSCTARLAACAAAGAPSVQPGSCRTLVCIRRADTLYQKNSAKPTAFFRRGAKRRALKIYLTHSARRGTLKAAIFYIFWEDLS